GVYFECPRKRPHVGGSAESHCSRYTGESAERLVARCRGGEAFPHQDRDQTPGRSPSIARTKGCLPMSHAAGLRTDNLPRKESEMNGGPPSGRFGIRSRRLSRVRRAFAEQSAACSSHSPCLWPRPAPKSLAVTPHTSGCAWAALRGTSCRARFASPSLLGCSRCIRPLELGEHTRLMAACTLGHP